MEFLSDAALRAIVVGGVPWNGIIGHPSSSLSVIAEHHKSSINIGTTDKMWSPGG